MNKEDILAKLGLQERGAFNILKDKSLCERILNENPIWIDDFLKKYDVSRTIINTLIGNEIIYCFSNVDTRGSKQFIFEDEALSQFSLKSNTTEVHKNINEVVELFVKISANFLSERQHNIVTDILINKMSYKDVSDKYNVTRLRVLEIFGKSLRRMNGRISRQKKIEELNHEYFELKAEYELLKLEHDLLKPENNQANFKINDLLNKRLVDIDFSIRTQNVFKYGGIDTVFELLCLDRELLLSIRGCGKKSELEIEGFLYGSGFYIGMLHEFYGNDYNENKIKIIALIMKKQKHNELIL
jgi:hypothetical protein